MHRCLDGRVRILQERFNIIHDVGVLEFGAVALHRDTILVDEELLKVPSDVRAADRGPLNGHGVRLDLVDKVRSSTATVIRGGRKSGLEIRPERLLILPVHDALRHDLEVGHVAVARTDMLKGVHEFKVRIIALMTKLVARETKNSQLVAVFVRQGIQLNEVPDGRASHSCDVVDQDDLALQLSEVELGAISGVRASPAAKSLALKVVKGSHRTHRRALKDTGWKKNRRQGRVSFFA